MAPAPQTRREARAQRERRRGLGKVTAAIAVATLAGLATVGATTALFNAMETLKGSTVTAGTMTLLINGASSAAALGDARLAPTTPVMKTFTVKNESTVPVSLKGQISVAAPVAITANTNAVMSIVRGTGTCPTTVPGTAAAINGYTNASLGNLAVGEQVRVCVGLSLNATTPTSQSGTGAPYSITMTSTQLDPNA